jgi:predicted glycogen debranching enzyme
MLDLTAATSMTVPTVVHFGREICGDFSSALRREWLVTNGLGGYASSTLAGINTRRYHGLLVASLSPPTDRTVLVSGFVEWATYNGRRYPLSTHEYKDSVIDPHGYRHLQSFTLEGMLPVWTFALADALLMRYVWMDYGSNTTYIQYRLLQATCPMELEITPLVTYRDFHSLSHGEGWQPGVEVVQKGAIIQAFDGAIPFRLLVNTGHFVPGGSWWWNFYHREEANRGLDCTSDLYSPGTFQTSLEPGDTTSLTLTTELGDLPAVSDARAAAEERQQHLLQLANAKFAYPPVKQLILAADQFIVERQLLPPTVNTSSESQTTADLQYNKTVIAGYPWFNDWGRDTMIALPGLTLSTGRPSDAANILRSFAQYIVDGLLPNNFPDQSGLMPGYNTVDATLWYVHAIFAYTWVTGDPALADDLLPILRTIVECHQRGTKYHIKVDPADGLLYAGEPGTQLTWMDAKIGDWVVTPRIGKPVEIQAIWYNTLRILESFLLARSDNAASEYKEQADRVRSSFLSRFWQPESGFLADVVDTPNGDDLSLRPNQIFAVSLPFSLLKGDQAISVVESVGRTLLTSYGLRSLSTDHPAYRGDYSGDQFRRDSGYHQGPIWPWLIGAYAEAHYRVYQDVDAVHRLLRPIEEHLCDAGLGSVSEIFEGDAPHLPRGCIAQAWSVAEILRVWRLVNNGG